MAKYLSRLLPSLAESIHATESTVDLMIKVKNEKILIAFNMVSFDVKILLTSVSANKPIHITLVLIYNRSETTTILRKVKTKSFLLLCAANVQFGIQ